MTHLLFLVRRGLHDLRSGLLFLPGLVLFAFGLLAALVLGLDSRPEVEDWVLGAGLALTG